MLKLSGGTLAGAGLLGLAGCGGGGGGSGSSGSDKTLNLGSIGWTENIAVANLTKHIFEESSTSEVKIEGPLELGLLFQGVAEGDLQAFQDVWLPNHIQFINKPQLKNDLELLDPWYQGQTAYGLTAPTYMGVDSIADLNNVDTDEIIGHRAERDLHAPDPGQGHTGLQPGHEAGHLQHGRDAHRAGQEPTATRSPSCSRAGLRTG